LSKYLIVGLIASKRFEIFKSFSLKTKTNNLFFDLGHGSKLISSERQKGLTVCYPCDLESFFILRICILEGNGATQFRLVRFIMMTSLQIVRVKCQKNCKNL